MSATHSMYFKTVNYPTGNFGKEIQFSYYELSVESFLSSWKDTVGRRFFDKCHMAADETNTALANIFKKCEPFAKLGMTRPEPYQSRKREIERLRPE